MGDCFGAFQDSDAKKLTKSTMISPTCYSLLYILFSLYFYMYLFSIITLFLNDVVWMFHHFQPSTDTTTATTLERRGHLTQDGQRRVEDPSSGREILREFLWEPMTNGWRPKCLRSD